MSTNLSKQKRDDLLSKISAIRAFIAAAPQDENTGSLLTYLSDLEKDVDGKKYGLVFEEHQETIDTVLAEHTPVLTEEPSLLIDNGGEMNFLLEGDNLAAMRLLGKTHRGRIDLIYIDPPYNTGNKDFVYDDCFVDAQDTFRHSKWLSFMSKRLEQAKNLLSDRGVIFISIDDREQAGLKLLCDSIFDESCFVADVSWQRTYSTRNDSKGIVSEVEHILVYSSKRDWSPNKLPRTDEMNSKYKNPDNDVAPWRTDNAYAADAATHQGMVYAIQHPFTGKMLYPSVGSHWRYKQADMLEIMCGWCDYELKDLHDEKKRAVICGIPESEVRQDVKAIVLSEPLEVSVAKAQKVYDKGPWPRFFFTKGGKGGIARKTYLDNVGGKLPTNFWPFADVGHTDEAKKEIGKILGDLTAFSTPKPVRLMERVITIASQPDSIILDFFAGSGTTGHAVLAHNAADADSRRKFILCTNNENNICRNVTYERIKRVMEREGYAASLKYYRIDYVPINEQLYYEYADQLLHHIRELVELENSINFIENAEIAIVLTDEELADFIARPEAFAKCHTLYLGHDILPTGEQDAAIKERGIRVNIIPDYYYRELEG
jgi:adenine-specific DNA-methyltransferase